MDLDSGSRRRARLAVLVSGGGRSLENLAEESASGRLDAEIACVISNTQKAFALERAKRLGIPARVIRPRDFERESDFGNAVFAAVEEHDVDFVVLAGFLVRLPMTERFQGRVINIHPALLPAFGGKGFYGHRVHEAVRRAGVKVSGCTVHFVDDEYDHGPIILQRTVEVAFEDSAEDIAARVFEQELRALPEAVQLLVHGRLEIEGGRVRVKA